MKYYIIAGESSGDLYGGMLIEAIKKEDPQADFRYWGGPKMKKAATGQLKSIKETSFMGFWEVAKNAIKIKGFFDFAKYSIKEYKPDIILFIDYPGFNLRMATWCKNKGYNTAYYISPQLWAWKEKRHKILREKVDLFFVILPFERDFYKNLDTPCRYVGHPLLEIIPPAALPNSPTDNQAQNPTILQPIPLHLRPIKTIGLFPGSRKQEIENHLKIMLEFAIGQPDYKFVIAGVSHINRSFYLKHINQYATHIDIVYDKAYDVMRTIDFAISSSGTATLELALFNVPQIVVYKTSTLTFMIAKRLVKTSYISLVNLISQKEIVPELLQEAFNPLALEAQFNQLTSSDSRKGMHDGYSKLRADLGEGNTSAMVARDIVAYVKEQAKPDA